MALRLSVSSTNKFKVLLLTLALASFKLTVTFMVLFSAAAYLLFPLKLTVIIVLPSLSAMILPSLTMATFSSLDLYVKLPASAGINVAPVSISPSTFKSIVVLVTLISVGTLVTVTLTIVEFSA